MSILMDARCVLLQHSLQGVQMHPIPLDGGHCIHASSCTVLSHRRWHSFLHDPYGFYRKDKGTSQGSRISFLKGLTQSYRVLCQPSIFATLTQLFEGHIFLPQSATPGILENLT